jgi:hypothetical protein
VPHMSSVGTVLSHDIGGRAGILAATDSAVLPCLRPLWWRGVWSAPLGRGGSREMGRKLQVYRRGHPLGESAGLSA